MLLQLPKDILYYILSIVLYDNYVNSYYHNPSDVKKNVEALVRCNFDCRYNYSKMASFVKQLSSIHSIIRKMLRASSWFDTHPWWGFEKRFFHTLCSHARVHISAPLLLF